MHSIGLDDVGSALLITLVMLMVSLTVVGLAMWWLYRVFKNKDEKAARKANRADASNAPKSE